MPKRTSAAFAGAAAATATPQATSAPAAILVIVFIVVSSWFARVRKAEADRVVSNMDIAAEPSLLQAFIRRSWRECGAGNSCVLRAALTPAEFFCDHDFGRGAGAKRKSRLPLPTAAIQLSIREA